MKKVFLSVFALILLSANFVTVHGQANISVPQAREIALAMTGGGTISSLELTSGAEGQVYQIVIVNNATRYDISINVQTGDVLRLTSGQIGAAAGAAAPAQRPAAQSPAPQQQGGIIIGNVVPRPPRRSGGPVNPPVSAQRAVEIAANHLASIGATNFRFDYVYMDVERGRWVWSVEFDRIGGGRDAEFYIDVHTGEIIQFKFD